MNPLGILFNYVASVIGTFATIGIFTLIVKLTCIPLRIRRYKKRTLKRLIRNFSSNKKSDPRKFRKKVLQIFEIRFFSVDQFSWLIDFILIFMLIASIKAVSVPYLSRNKIAIVYLFILLLIEYLDTLANKTKLKVNIETIVKLVLILLLYYLSLTTIAEIIVYWCFASIINFIIDFVIKRKYHNIVEEGFNFIIYSKGLDREENVN